MGVVEEMRDRIFGLPDKEREETIRAFVELTKDCQWIPNPGPQTQAYYSKADILLYGGEPGGGKGLDIQTLIPTPFGFTTMGELRIGDEVFDRFGQPCKVTFKSPVHHRPCYKLTFSDGASIVADDEHLWVTRTRRERLRAWGSSAERRSIRRATRPLRGNGKRPDLALRNTKMAATKMLPLESVRDTKSLAVSVDLGGRINHSVDVAGALQLPAREVLIDPYVLGAWLGDGSSDSGSLAGIDEEIFTSVANAGYVITRRADPYVRGVLGIQKQLNILGVLRNKHIPQAYLRASHEQRLALLHGLMDTDGHCDKRGQCEIQLTRKVLIDGVRELLSSLGIKVQMHEGVAKLNGRVTSKKWRLKFITELPAFRLARKLIRQKRSCFRGTHAARYLLSVDPVQSVPTQCIQVDSPSKTYLAGEEMIPTHNTQLIIGLAFNEHQNSLLMRRQYSDMEGGTGLIAQALTLNGGRAGFNGSPPPKLTRPDGKVIDFGAAKLIGDEQHWQGKPHDFLGIDEGAQFAKLQVLFLMIWLRTNNPNQRRRAVIATNPPLTSEGMWLIEMFAPWLDEKYPFPAKPGELRWFVLDEDDRPLWVNGKNDSREINGKLVDPKSATFIPAAVSDNPYLASTGYQKELDAMPEVFKRILLGKFKALMRDAPNQMVPTAWVQAAMDRWKHVPPEGIPMCAMGVDPSGGGPDPMVIAPRYDGWFAPPIVEKGSDIPQHAIGKHCAGIVLQHRRSQALVVIDLGGGYGGSIHEHLTDNQIECYGYKGAEATTRRSSDKRLRFTNTRSAAYWQFREALDPGQPGGSPIALPPDPEIVADLTAPTFEPMPNGIKMEPKVDVCERLGRSTNKGDAIVMSWWAGPKETTNALEWADQKMARKMGGMQPKVILGRQHVRR